MQLGLSVPRMVAIINSNIVLLLLLRSLPNVAFRWPTKTVSNCNYSGRLLNVKRSRSISLSLSPLSRRREMPLHGITLRAPFAISYRTIINIIQPRRSFTIIFGKHALGNYKLVSRSSYYAKGFKSRFCYYRRRRCFLSSAFCGRNS